NLERAEAEVRALSIQIAFSTVYSFRVAAARDDYAFLTKEETTVGGDRDRIYIHPYGSSIVYEVREKERSK
ncbi:hypothetical protein HYX17_04150, partial [Candidatus Woesearchaeota archaeon]|nr:hypothetical protein [Candidatus Woesearchaeota archaeon]